MHTAQLVRLLAAAALITLLLHVAQSVAGGAKAPQPYTWQPELSPSGPMVLIVSLPLQAIHVYRNGVRIGASAISSGKPGHETPVGTFTILQKHVEHYSNLYDNAPMPYMQRLTWGGVALHAGELPGRPASHGCIRLPAGFAKVLYGATRRGDVVIVSERADPPGIASGIAVLLSRPAASGAGPVGAPTGTWFDPGRAGDGPVSIVLSTTDRRVAVMRNGRLIGGAPIHVADGVSVSSRAYVLLADATASVPAAVTDKKSRRWMIVGMKSNAHSDDPVALAFASGSLAVAPGFAAQVDSLLAPGTTVVVTDEPLGADAVEALQWPLYIESAEVDLAPAQ